MLRDRSILCIDWDERSLRVLAASISRKMVRIRKAVHVPLDETVNARDPASLGEFIRRTLATHRIRTRKATVAVHRQDTVLNLLSLPKGTAEETAQMVDVQAGKELPFSKDQAVVDFAYAGDADGAMRPVWMAALRTAVLDRYQQTIANAGLKLERIGLRPYANIAALDPDLVAEGRTLLVDVGASMTEIDVVQAGRLVFSRAASVSIPAGGLLGSPEPFAPEDQVGVSSSREEAVSRPAAIDALLIEVSRTLQAYRATDPGAAIDRIVLAGTEGIDQQVANRFEQQFGAATSMYGPPASLRWRRPADFSTAPFSSIVGLAVSGAGDPVESFDFLSPKEPEAAQRVRRRRRPLAIATVAIFVTAIFAMAYIPFRLKYREIDRQTMLKKFEEVQMPKANREELMKHVDDVKAWRAMNYIWIDKLNQLAEVFPSNKDCFITRMDCNDKGEIKIELVTKDVKEASHLAEAIATIKGEDGIKITALGGKATSSNEPGYPIKDQVTINLKPAKVDAKETKKK